MGFAYFDYQPIKTRVSKTVLSQRMSRICTSSGEFRTWSVSGFVNVNRWSSNISSDSDLRTVGFKLPRMNERKPVIVADGMDGKPFVSKSESEWNGRFFRFQRLEPAVHPIFGFLRAAREPSDANKERKALSENIRTAMDASSCSKRISQGTSWTTSGLDNAEILNRPRMIIPMFRQKEWSNTSFWPIFIRTFQSRPTGILITDA